MTNHDIAPAETTKTPKSIELVKSGDSAVISKNNPETPLLGTVTLDAFALQDKTTLEDYQEAMLGGMQGTMLHEHAPIAATIEMGGHEGHPVEKIHFIRVANLPIEFSAPYALSQGLEPSTVEWLLLYDAAQNGQAAQAFLGKGTTEEIGRAGSLKWNFFNPGQENPETPFQENNSISRKQLRVNDFQGNLVLTALTDNSMTRVTLARPIQEVQ